VIEQVCAICDRHRLSLANVFHAGDGNLHPNISFDRRDPDELARVLQAGAEILALCVAAGGVITGEHGIGTEKRDFMGLLFGDDDLDAMRRLRAAFDPDGICNPGKVLPTPRFCAESNPRARGYDRVTFE
jgi:FAD/FMN-containing dehydrogenase